MDVVASHEHMGEADTDSLISFAPKIEYLLFNFEHYHSDTAVIKCVIPECTNSCFLENEVPICP